MEFGSHFELLWLDAIEVEENFVLLQGSKFGITKAQIPLKQLNVVLTVELVDLLKFIILLHLLAAGIFFHLLFQAFYILQHLWIWLPNCSFQHLLHSGLRSSSVRLVSNPFLLHIFHLFVALALWSLFLLRLFIDGRIAFVSSQRN